MVSGFTLGYDFAFWLNFMIGVLFFARENTITKCILAWLALLIFVA
tara:strand:- start:50585 stop:50722 length:138 start_codon:yes stop_codon:yes gene_type:complete